MDIFDGYHEINEKIRYTDSKFSSLKNLPVQKQSWYHKPIILKSIFTHKIQLHRPTP